jgi:hypothetical protein
MAQESERKVKGTFLIALAMVINDQKQVDWKGQTRMTDGDLKLIKDRIMASGWYDTDFYDRVGSGVYKITGKNRPEGAQQFGEGIMWKVLTKVYASSLMRNDPGRALLGFAMLYKGTFFNTGEAEYKSADQGGIFKISDPYGIPSPESFIPMIKGLLIKIALENNAKNARVEYEQAYQPAAKPNSFSYKISWDKK